MNHTFALIGVLMFHSLAFSTFAKSDVVIGFLLRQITTSQSIFGNRDGTLLARNVIRKGVVLFTGCDVTQLSLNDGEIFYSMIATVLPEIKIAERPPSKANEPIKTPSAAGAQTSGWGLQPLGPDIPKSSIPLPKRKHIAEPGFSSLPAHGEPVTLVEDGQPRAIIVVRDQAGEDIRWGAEKIRDVVKKISTVSMPIVAERDIQMATGDDGVTRVFYKGGVVTAILVGDTKLGQKLGADPSELRDEGLRVATAPGGIILVYGRDIAANGMETHGTLNAVSHFLERQLGYRALWPGENGEVFPNNRTMRIEPVDEIDAPAIPVRVMRSTGYNSSRSLIGVERLGKSKEEFDRRARDYGNWARLQKLGCSVNVSYGHSFEGWWDKYGKIHPEWFALQPNGTRIQTPPREMLAYTNPELAEFVANEKITELKENPGQLAVSISPNDGSSVNSVCMSEEARKFDPPNGDPVRLLFQLNGERVYRRYPSLTDRYLVFFNRIAERVAKEFPDRYVAAYAYGPYRSAPLYQGVHPNLIIGFVGFFYFDDFKERNDQENWNRWAAKANYIFLRPNLLLGGAGYPAFYAQRMADDLRHCYETGMMGADYSSVAGHWANVGMMYYLLPKLLWNPTADVNALINDYLDKGFGPAASVMARYYAKVQSLTEKAAAQTGSAVENEMRDEEMEVINSNDRFMQLAPSIYNANALKELRVLLDEAKQKAIGHADILARIDFVEQGVTFADFQSKIYSARMEGKAANKERMRDLLERRYEFFQQLFEKNFFAVGLAHLGWQEGWVAKNDYGWKPKGVTNRKGDIE